MRGPCERSGPGVSAQGSAQEGVGERGLRGAQKHARGAEFSMAKSRDFALRKKLRKKVREMVRERGCGKEACAGLCANGGRGGVLSVQLGTCQNFCRGPFLHSLNTGGYHLGTTVHGAWRRAKVWVVLWGF